MADLTAAESALLDTIFENSCRAIPNKPKKSRERDGLQRKGMVVSEAANPPGRRMIGGHGMRWRLTEQGHAVAIGRSASLNIQHGHGDG